MEDVLPYLLGAAMVATLAVLLVGVVSFGVHGEFYLRHANRLMRLRVLFQAAAVALMAGMVYLAVA